jgi:hypothetical protein
LLSVFDRPAFAVNCPQRDASVIPLQSLTMLNDEFIAEEAEHLASRVASDASASGELAVRRAFGLALARDPSARETRQCIEFLDRQRRECQKCGASDDHAMKTALAQLCRTLYNTSEFLYSE